MTSVSTAAPCRHPSRPTRGSRLRHELALLPPPPPGRHKLPHIHRQSITLEQLYSGAPTAGEDCSSSKPDKSYQPHNAHFPSHTHHSCTTHTQWDRLGTTQNNELLLLIAGIERNPGPNTTETQHHITLSHININSTSKTPYWAINERALGKKRSFVCLSAMRRSRRNYCRWRCMLMSPKFSAR